MSRRVPAALEAAKKWNPKQEMSVSNSCKIPSIVYALQGPFPIEIMQGKDIIVMRLEYFDMARTFFFDKRFALPPGAPGIGSVMRSPTRQPYSAAAGSLTNTATSPVMSR